MEYFKLNNGTKIPAAGIGTFMMSPDDAEEAVYNAFRNGYEMVDTANAYMNEKAVGRGIARAGVSRSDIYVSTKLWPSIYSDAANAIDATLKRLGTDYIDLLFLHQPVGDIKGAYRAMEDAVKAGKVRSLGLSNFSIEQIKEIADTEEIKPAVIQVEAHPYYPQTELKGYLKTIGAVVMAWYPLGHGDKNLVNEQVFSELGRKYGKSNAQIILRWHIQSGNIVIPGSRNPQHIKDNIDLFDFSLSDEDMASIASVNKNRRYYTQTEEALQRYLHMAPDFDSQK
ncbi:MAG: aldo/keto reductase [Oscillospiraceae bacterium]|jgi:diketogulonate reductase-like aldo/keto reductase